MHDEKKRILDMLAEGRLSADEAMLLLEQLEEAPASAPLASAFGRDRLLRVRVHIVEGGNPKPTTVNINLPLQVARVIGRLVTVAMPPQATNALHENGIDLSEIDWVEIIGALSETGGDIVNIEHEDKETQVTVRVYVE